VQPSGDNSTVVLTGCGLVTALGLDAANACAAARAGILRAAQLDAYPIRSLADGSVSGAVGHAVPLLTEGFEGEARLIRLLQGGFEDLARQCPEAPWKRKRTAFYLSVPDIHRLFSGAELVADDAARKEMREAAKAAGNTSPGEARAARLLSEGARMAKWPGRPELKWCADSGNTGVAEAILRASDDLRAGACEVGIVGGVDSLLDEDTLFWLEQTGRLKTPNLATGLQPGEAGGFLVFEKAPVASAQNRRTLTRLETVCLGMEAHPLVSGEPPSGVGLAEVVYRAATTTPWGRQRPFWLIHDLNGESYRAQEWGGALFRLAARERALAEPKVWLSAASFGDTGAATGVVQACMALRAFERSYAPAGFAGMVSTASGGRRGCFVLHRN
jgi:3-oxoacyl-[acyl-carrier-protein] synthase I